MRAVLCRCVRSAQADRKGAATADASIAAAVTAINEGLAPSNDALASAWYRREVVGVHLRRLLSGQE